jgi:hypothetical protein
MHQANAGSSDLSFDFELVGLVNFSNSPPTANAGPDLTIDVSTNAVLNGAATDDGLPNPPGVYNANWSTVSGPGSVAFADATVPRTTATFSVGGAYVLRLTVTDGELTATDDVQVTVTGADPYEAWRAANFSAAELSNPAISGENADPDGDAFTNRQEYIAGTKPKDPSSYLHIEEVTREASDFVIRFKAVGDKSYSIEGRSRFGDDEWEPILDLSPQGATKMLEILDPLSADPDQRYYRVVTPQKPPR